MVDLYWISNTIPTFGRPPGRLIGGVWGGGCPPRNQVKFRLLAAPGQYEKLFFRYLARSGTWHDQVPGTIWYLARSDNYLIDQLIVDIHIENRLITRLIN